MRTGLFRSPFAFPFLHAYRNAHVQRFFLSHRLSAYAPLCKATGSDCARTRCTSDKADIDGGPANARSRQTGPLALHHRRPGSKAESRRARSEEHTSELQSQMRISYAVF